MVKSRLLRYAAILLLALVLASAPFTLPRLSLILPTFVQLPPVSVIDPSTQPAEPPVPLEALLFAGQITDQITAGHFANASSLLKLASVLPGNLQADLSTYLNILAEINSQLNLTNTYLNETSTSISLGKLNQARTQLELARSELTQARTNLQTLTLTLARIQTLFGISVESQQTKLAALSKLIGHYEDRANQLNAMLIEVDTRAPTFLDLKASATAILVNETITLTGRLEDSKQNGLSDRAIMIYLQGMVFEETSTSKDGFFNLTARITPKLHVTAAIFFAHFEPNGTDASSLRPSTSSDVFVAVRYLRAKMSLVLGSRSVHVNQTFEATGRLQTQDGSPLEDRMIQVAVDGMVVESTETGRDGRFAFDYSFPPGTSELTHNITATFVPSDDLYSGQSASANLDVYYYHTSLSASLSSGWLFSGQPFQVKGTVEAGSERIGNGTVLALLNGTQTANTTVAPDGGFQLSLSVPIDAFSNSYLVILYLPTTPWVKGTSAGYSLAVTNSLSVLVGSSTLAIVGLAVYKSPRTILLAIKRSLIEEEETREEEVEEPSEEVGVAAPEPLIDIPKISKGRTQNETAKLVYWAVRELVALKLKIPSQSSLTHWEFLKAAADGLKKGDANLRNLTFTFELAEYAERPLTKVDVDRAINDSVVIVESVGGKITV